MIGETVSIVHETPGGTDAYGDPIASTTTTTTAVPGCAFAPRASTEPTERGRQGVIIGGTIYLPAGTTIAHEDQVIVRGVTYDVEGEPGEWVSPFTGWAPGVEVAVKRAEG